MEENRPGDRLIGGRRGMFSPQGETLSESEKTQRACPFPPCLTACSLRRRVLLRGTEQVAWGLATPGSLGPCRRSEGEVGSCVFKGEFSHLVQRRTGGCWGAWREGGAGAPPGSRVGHGRLRRGFGLTLLSWESPFPTLGLKLPLSNDDVGLDHWFPSVLSSLSATLESG